MDNFSSHKVVGIKEAIESVGAHLIYLSPYSPDFYPIENFWSKVKEFLRSQETRIYSDLDKAITEAFETVSLSDILVGFNTVVTVFHPIENRYIYRLIHQTFLQ